MTSSVSSSELTCQLLMEYKRKDGDTSAGSDKWRISLRSLNMIWTIIGVLFVLWLLGVVTSYTFGGFIHLLLLAALVVVVISVFRGRRFV